VFAVLWCLTGTGGSGCRIWLFMPVQTPGSLSTMFSCASPRSLPSAPTCHGSSRNKSKLKKKKRRRNPDEKLTLLKLLADDRKLNNSIKQSFLTVLTVTEIQCTQCWLLLKSCVKQRLILLCLVMEELLTPSNLTLILCIICVYNSFNLFKEYLSLTIL